MRTHRFFCYLASMNIKAILLVAGLAVFSILQAQDTAVLGKLCFVNVEEGEQPVMTALRLSGNRCGSELFNNKPCSADGIRSVFELDEWIEFHPQAHAGSGRRNHPLGFSVPSSR